MPFIVPLADRTGVASRNRDVVLDFEAERVEITPVGDFGD
jgi:hypothetical protein